MEKSAVLPDRPYPGRLREADIRFIYERMETCRPARLVAVDADGDIMSLFRRCARELGLDCRIEQCAFSALPDLLDGGGEEIGLLFLNAVCNMPVELLNFILALPCLKRGAVVILLDAVFREPASGLSFASSVLFQSVTASRFPHNRQFYPDIRERLKLCRYTEAYPPYSSIYRGAHLQFHIVSAFCINEDTLPRVGDLFAALRIAWPYMPGGGYISAWGAAAAKRYSPDYMELYRQAAEGAERLFNPLYHILEVFASRRLLLYGKGRRGRALLEFSKKTAAAIAGFVVSDGQPWEAYCEGLPVYYFSQIPFDREEALIIQTVESKRVETLLQQSGRPWLKLPESFWWRFV